MRIERYFTKPDVSPYEPVAFATTKSEIRNPDGSIVFALEGVEVDHQSGGVDLVERHADFGGRAGGQRHGDERRPRAQHCR